jgi:hypothetical protein
VGAAAAMRAQQSITSSSCVAASTNARSSFVRARGSLRRSFRRALEERSARASSTGPGLLQDVVDPDLRRIGVLVFDQLACIRAEHPRQLLQLGRCRHALAALERRNVSAGNPGALCDVTATEAVALAQLLQPRRKRSRIWRIRGQVVPVDAAPRILGRWHP